LVLLSFKHITAFHYPILHHFLLSSPLQITFLFFLPDTTASLMENLNPNELPTMAMTEYKAKRDSCRQKIASKYDILGFISSGTYGRVYKAKSKNKYAEQAF